MSTTDELLKANERYAQSFQLGHLPGPPARKLAVLACMDAPHGRTDSRARDRGRPHHPQRRRDRHRGRLALPAHLPSPAGDAVEKQTGTAAFAPVHFHTFTDLESNVRRQIERVRSHPWIPKQISVRGFIYDVKTGRLHEVRSSAETVAA
ncbi:MAG TPA: hypothetical protein VES66_02560 [Terriglobales bacterium]|nr:hypothetical protein [Terriglobales bacterium]